MGEPIPTGQPSGEPTSLVEEPDNEIETSIFKLAPEEKEENLGNNKS